MVSENKYQGEADTFIFKAGDYFSITMSNLIFINVILYFSLNDFTHVYYSYHYDVVCISKAITGLVMQCFTMSKLSHQVAKVLELQCQHQSFQRVFRDDFLED